MSRGDKSCLEAMVPLLDDSVEAEQSVVRVSAGLVRPNFRRADHLLLDFASGVANHDAAGLGEGGGPNACFRDRCVFGLQYQMRRPIDLDVPLPPPWRDLDNNPVRRHEDLPMSYGGGHPPPKINLCLPATPNVRGPHRAGSCSVTTADGSAR